MSDSLNQIIRELQQRQCETQTVEAKSAAQGTPKVHDTLSSFSNQNDGGVILFGVDENRHYQCTGVWDAQRLQKDVISQCEEMMPEIRVSFDTEIVDEAVVVAAFVEGRPMSERPVYRRSAGISKGSFTRIGDADKHMTQVELYEIESFKNGTRDDQSTNPDATEDMLSPSLVDVFCLNATKERPQLARRAREEVLRLSGVMRRGRPTLAALMVLGDYPQQIYPNLCVAAAVVQGDSISSSAPMRFVDSKRFEGTIGEMLEASLSFVTRNTKMRTVIENGSRRDIPEYPPDAIREVILNALVHRDYGPYSNGTPVRLTIFSNRIECWNPGGIYGGQEVDDLGFVNIPSRNPTLISLMEIMGEVENRHSGIPVMRDEMEQAGLRPPVFVDRQGSFLVQLFNEPTETDKGAPLQENERNDGEMGRSRTDRLLSFCLTPRSRSEIAGFLDLNEAYAMRTVVNPLVESGQLKLTIPDKPRSKDQRFLTA